MRNYVGLALLLIGSAGFAVAGFISAPEIDASTGVGALTLFAGALLVIRARRKN
jgi:hypothetical protein